MNKTMTPLIYLGLEPLSRFGFLNRAKVPIMYIVSEVLGVTLEDVAGKTRKYKAVMARCLICYFTRKHTKMTLSEIGASLGGRDHSTVIYQIEQYPLRYEYEDQFRRLANKVELMIPTSLSGRK